MRVGELARRAATSAGSSAAGASPARSRRTRCVGAVPRVGARTPAPSTARRAAGRPSARASRASPRALAASASRLARPALAEPRQQQRRRTRAARRPAPASSANAETGRSGRPAGERARDEERRRRDGDEVPVDVDERVHEVGGQEERERELVPARPAPTRTQQRRAREHEEQRAPTMPASARNCSGRLCGSVVVVEVRRAVAQVRQRGTCPRRCPRARGAASRPRLAPPGEAEVRARVASRPPPFPTAPEPPPLHDDDDASAATTSDRRARRPRRAARAAHGTRASSAGATAPATSSAPKIRPSRQRTCRRLAVARHAGQRERDPDDGRCRHRRGEQRAGALERARRSSANHATARRQR